MGRRGAAAPLGTGPPRRGARLCAARCAGPRRARASPPGSTTSGATCSPIATSSRARCPASPTRSRGTRTRRASPCGRSSTRSTSRVSRARRRGSRRARTGSTGCSGPSETRRPGQAHAGWIRRLSPLEATYTRERSVEVCLATLRAMGFDLDAEKGIRPDLEDRPQKSPRACVIAADPPRVVHLITRAQGGLHDYEAFLHEAGHALHYAGCDPALPLSFRRLARDHALTEIYSFLLDSISQRARVARRALRPVRCGGERERRRRPLLERAALPPLLGEARLRARLLVTIRRPMARRRRATRSGSRRRPGSGIPGELPLRHGCRLLLRRLPPRVDPLGAAPRAPAARDRARLVAHEAGPERCSACSSSRARGRRRRRSPSGSGSTRSTPRRSCPSCPSGSVSPWRGVQDDATGDQGRRIRVDLEVGARTTASKRATAVTSAVSCGSKRSRRAGSPARAGPHALDGVVGKTRSRMRRSQQSRRHSARRHAAWYRPVRSRVWRASCGAVPRANRAAPCGVSLEGVRRRDVKTAPLALTRPRNGRYKTPESGLRFRPETRPTEGT